ncbi:hypothetical protein GIB67_007104 [Kingdonia uniflora]|uniref:Uncharacterized protein n=1 Tax=Kingdonia uniflora TaxID=39325 RepID=A0A7J7MLF1_9MAGN|nr:hypothetical protein GIB67_007104 [Kingdonia uniflora]
MNSNAKISVPEFDGKTTNACGFIDLFNQVDRVLAFKKCGDSRAVTLMETKHTGYVLNWWEGVQQLRVAFGGDYITDWGTMRQELMIRFIPASRLVPVVADVALLVPEAFKPDLTMVYGACSGFSFQSPSTEANRQSFAKLFSEKLEKKPDCSTPIALDPFDKELSYYGNRQNTRRNRMLSKEDKKESNGTSRRPPFQCPSSFYGKDSKHKSASGAQNINASSRLSPPHLARSLPTKISKRCLDDLDQARVLTVEERIKRFHNVFKLEIGDQKIDETTVIELDSYVGFCMDLSTESHQWRPLPLVETSTSTDALEVDALDWKHGVAVEGL